MFPRERACVSRLLPVPDTHAECECDAKIGPGNRVRLALSGQTPVLPQQRVDEGRGLEWGQIVGALPQAN